MYTRILVPLDGSELAERVLPHVEALTTKFGSAVMLLRVTTSVEALPPTPSMALGPLGVPTAGPIFDRVAFAREEREEAIQYLAALAEGLQKRGLLLARVMNVTYLLRACRRFSSASVESVVWYTCPRYGFSAARAASGYASRTMMKSADEPGFIASATSLTNPWSIPIPVRAPTTAPPRYP